MTTGSDLQDLRQPQRVDGGAFVNTGLYWLRTWSGSDNPQPRPVFPRIFDPGHGQYLQDGFEVPPKRGKRQLLGEHPYSCVIQSWCSYVGSVLYSSDQKYHAVSSESWAHYPTFQDKWTSNDDIKLIGSLRDKILGSDFNPAVTMAEGKEALETILHVTKSLSKAIDAAKRGDLKKALDAVTGYEKSKGAKRAAASNWLQWQYGIRPMLNDVYNAAIYLAHLASVPVQQSYTVTVKRLGVINTQSPSNATWNSGYGFRAKKIKAILTEINVVHLLGLTDPVQVAWEKLPYSFVADWFVPVGSFLAARGVAQSLSGTFVTTDVIKTEGHGLRAPPGNSYLGFDSVFGRSVSVNRTISSSLSVPLPSVKPLSSWVSWSHATSATALLINKHGS